MNLWFAMKRHHHVPKKNRMNENHWNLKWYTYSYTCLSKFVFFACCQLLSMLNHFFASAHIHFFSSQLNRNFSLFTCSYLHIIARNYIKISVRPNQCGESHFLFARYTIHTRRAPEIQWFNHALFECVSLARRKSAFDREIFFPLNSMWNDILWYWEALDRNGKKLSRVSYCVRRSKLVKSMVRLCMCQVTLHTERANERTGQRSECSDYAATDKAELNWKNLFLVKGTHIIYRRTALPSDATTHTGHIHTTGNSDGRQQPVQSKREPIRFTLLTIISVSRYDVHWCVRATRLRLCVCVCACSAFFASTHSHFNVVVVERYEYLATNIREIERWFVVYCVCSIWTTPEHTTVDGVCARAASINGKKSPNRRIKRNADKNTYTHTHTRAERKKDSYIGTQ